MDGYAKKMEESSVRHLRIQLKKKIATNKQRRFQHYEAKEQGKP